MHSKEYLEARREFVNCIIMAPFGLFIVPYYNAFCVWLPIMRREKKEEAQLLSAKA